MFRRGIIIGCVLIATAILFAQRTAQQAGNQPSPMHHPKKRGQGQR
jgi:hypothetical protein